MAPTSDFDVIQDERVRRTLVRLHAAAEKQTPQLLIHYLPKLPSIVLGRRLFQKDVPFDGFYKDKFLALEPGQAAMVYTLARSVSARRMVEFGTSLGISTIWLALAARETGGLVITTEIVPEKVERARQHLEEAGLTQYVEFRVGDALETLRDLDGPVDLFLNDGFPMKALPVLQLLRPRLSLGAPVITDNVGTFPADLAELIAWVRDPANGFVSVTLPYKGGTELSVNIREG